MYSTCLFCSASLGTNEAIETFPVGRRVAFDAWKGRLWAVCSRCGRWNLAPLEERWEAVEAAERLYTDTRTRVQSDNIGLCRLPDGTRLVRVGKALPGEIAAWRYGSQLISRRRQHIAVIGAGLVTGGAIVAGLPLIMSAGVPIMALQAGVQLHALIHGNRQRNRIVQRIAAARSPTGSELVVRRRHLYNAVLTEADGDIGVRLPTPSELHEWKRPAAGWRESTAAPLELTGGDARRLLARAMTDYNAAGATREQVNRALQEIQEAGGPAEFTRRAAGSGAAITKPERLGRRKSRPYTLRQIAGTFRGEILPVEKYGSAFSSGLPQLPKTSALALEMALNEDAERAALEGELAALEAAWREAEEIAHIADRLVAAPRGSAADTQVSSRKKA